MSRNRGWGGRDQVDASCRVRSATCTVSWATSAWRQNSSPKEGEDAGIEGCRGAEGGAADVLGAVVVIGGVTWARPRSRNLGRGARATCHLTVEVDEHVIVVDAQKRRGTQPWELSDTKDKWSLKEWKRSTVQ